MTSSRRRVLGIIPARMASSRLPGKPLAQLAGMPMIGHVYFRSKRAESLDDVVIATCDQEIRQYGESIGAKVVMTSDQHERASERIAEAYDILCKTGGKDWDVIVLIQGDEPMITPRMIDLAVRGLEESDAKVVNLMSRIPDYEEALDPSEIKVVCSRDNKALYFSRHAIPYPQTKSSDVVRWKQICIIPFERDFLREYLKMDTTELERVESIDMNRLLELGHAVQMVPCEDNTYAVDTPSDRDFVESLLKADPLTRLYSNF